ncbi:class I SAM-dependent methyltransferase [Natronogracilivirga saccharolytica]|uniref:Class I SAM-dependent methyltransferase n=1 Tax=Natronogracilivirga saccharolytica TaxID=2812953 RepID=A0A8J7RRL7_9BACT|nr:class I SAM-dependent methyltransferase [Natronogracilivirga saccharolytica]MBP3191682.1 class I SAM-dependent methyltransferase [Natronogracilivirga saccharolytica]
MKPSETHNNRRPHNWLLYDQVDHMLVRYAGYISGVVYDLGCGERPFESYFLRHGSSYVGVDWASSQHDSKADVVADLNEPVPVGDQVADTVISISVLEHLHSPLVMLKEAHRILRPGGTLLLQVPFMWHIHEEPHDYFRYTRYGLEHLLGQAGFRDIEIHATSGFWSTWFIKLNYQLIRLIRGPRLIRRLSGAVLYPFFHLNQLLGRGLDRIWFDGSKETQGYFVKAVR